MPIKGRAFFVIEVDVGEGSGFEASPHRVQLHSLTAAAEGVLQIRLGFGEPLALLPPSRENYPPISQ